MITNAKEFSEVVCQEVCLLFRGAQDTPTRETIYGAIEHHIRLKRSIQPLLANIDMNIVNNFRITSIYNKKT